VGKLSVHQLTPAFSEVMPYPLNIKQLL